MSMPFSEEQLKSFDDKYQEYWDEDINPEINIDLANELVDLGSRFTKEIRSQREQIKTLSESLKLAQILHNPNDGGC